MSEKGQIEGPNAVQAELDALGAEIKKLRETEGAEMSEKGQIEGLNAVQAELEALGAEIKKLEEKIKTIEDLGEQVYSIIEDLEI